MVEEDVLLDSVTDSSFCHLRACMRARFHFAFSFFSRPALFSVSNFKDV
jgi:hypothetical protein